MPPQAKNEEASFSIAKERNRSTLPLSVGVGIASIHFVVAYLLDAPFHIVQINLYNFWLTAPFFILLFTFSNFLPLSSVLGRFEDLPAFYTILKLLAVIVSSLFYGTTGAFLASRRKGLKVVALIVIGVLILGGGMLFVSLIALLGG